MDCYAIAHTYLAIEYCIDLVYPNNLWRKDYSGIFNL